MNGSITDKTPGWTFKPSEVQDGLTFNPHEGYYADKGGQLIGRIVEAYFAAVAASVASVQKSIVIWL